MEDLETDQQNLDNLHLMVKTQRSRETTCPREDDQQKPPRSKETEPGGRR